MMSLGGRARGVLVGAIVSSAWFACDARPTVSVDDAGDGARDSAVALVDASGDDAARFPDASPDAERSDAASSTDGGVDATPPPLHRVVGHVDYGGDVVGATVTLLAPFAASTTTDAKGDFEFFLPEGRAAIFKVTPPASSDALPMIRGLVVRANARFRQYYLVGRDERAAAQALGVTIDPTKAIVEVDFRNAATGGYSAILKRGVDVLAPGFGIALTAQGTPTLSTSTIVGGGGSTLILGNVPPATITVTSTTSGDASVCQPCDAPELPAEAGVVTWVDYECGAAACQ